MYEILQEEALMVGNSDILSIAHSFQVHWNTVTEDFCLSVCFEYALSSGILLIHLCFIYKFKK